MGTGGGEGWELTTRSSTVNQRDGDVVGGGERWWGVKGCESKKRSGGIVCGVIAGGGGGSRGAAKSGQALICTFQTTAICRRTTSSEWLDSLHKHATVARQNRFHLQQTVRTVTDLFFDSTYPSQRQEKKQRYAAPRLLSSSFFEGGGAVNANGNANLPYSLNVESAVHGRGNWGGATCAIWGHRVVYPSGAHVCSWTPGHHISLTVESAVHLGAGGALGPHRREAFQDARRVHVVALAL